MINYLKLPLSKKKIETISNYNPIFDQDKQKFNLEEYLKINKINFKDILSSECFICYEKLSDCKRLCIPHKCNHIICYKCFSKYCKSLHKINFSKDISDKVFCPICRKPVKNEWKYSKKMYFFRDEIENIKMEFVVPKTIFSLY